MKAKVIVLLVLVVLFTIFVTQNTEETGVMMFFWPLTLPKIVLLIITLVLGFILGLITATLIDKKHYQKVRQREEGEKIKSRLQDQEKNRTEQKKPGQ